MIESTALGPTRRTILVTGFGSFPGVARNPTEAIIADLRRQRARLARLGVTLVCAVVPVRYAAIEGTIGALVAEHRPDVILHLGVASRRRRISVETRAINRAGPLHPDAARERPEQILSAGSPSVLRTTYPARRILAALRAERIDAVLSIDAGDYVCNATLYRSLLTSAAREVGFLHVPKPRADSIPKARASRTATQADLKRAVLAATLTLGRINRVDRRTPENQLLVNFDCERC